jgi:hypothetical protein
MRKQQFKAQVVLTAEEKSFISDLAREEGLTLSNFIRQKIGMPLLKRGINLETNNHRKKS